MGLTKTLLQATSQTKPGKRNLITDVPGVKVGQQTIINDHFKTGVTAIIPGEGNCFRDKFVASSQVINGFGKSIGLVQVEELGTIETPLLLTNTFAVGTAQTELIKTMLKDNPEIGLSTGTVNPIVLECNDGEINHIRDFGVQPSDVDAALANCGKDFEEGCVGGGTGMCCYDLKGGIGSSSRQIAIDGQTYTIGALVMANFGFLEDLTIYGIRIGQELAHVAKEKEKGSIITVIATDIPFNERQLKRIAKRSSVGITRSGSFTGNGSGEITLAFSTANRVAHFPQKELSTQMAITDDKIDRYFRATVDVVHESILSALCHATTTLDREGKPRLCLKDALLKLDNADAQYLLTNLGLI
ncbi:P1 family peptidase [Lactobacillus sp. ESL0791]|uniref:DmpA family aminopeptidase n=1 Tax=Lactobacillus sp. ESL0791 TaxID=2983234 RepID=UPI0023F9F3F9|nr:P1 family peptidase [Lactobacillus sp. ESL0791]MDF7639245.1 P1 family peptidase [Lactobacillus sp. ESL0791]